MASPDGEDLATELEQLQQRIGEIREELAQRSDPPSGPQSKPRAAERAAKRWGLGVVIVGLGIALWFVTRTQPQVVAALGFVATAAAGVLVGVLLPESPDSTPSQAAPPSVTNESTRTTTGEPPDTTQGSPPTATPGATAPEPTTAPQSTPERAPVAEAEQTVLAAPAPTQPPAQPEPEQNTPPPQDTPPPDERNGNDPPAEESPEPTEQPDCTGLHVDASPVAEACVLGESVLEAEVLG